MTLTAAFAAELDELGIWHPTGNADALRSSAAAWTTAADLLDDVAVTLDAASQRIGEHHRGDAATRFASVWARWSGEHGHLLGTVAAMRRIAAALVDFSTDIDTADRALLRLIEDVLVAASVPRLDLVDEVHRSWLADGADDLARRLADAAEARAGGLAASLGAVIELLDPSDRDSLTAAAVDWPSFGAPIDLGHLATTAVDFGAGPGRDWSVIAPVDPLAGVPSIPPVGPPPICGPASPSPASGACPPPDWPVSTWPPATPWYPPPATPWYPPPATVPSSPWYPPTVAPPVDSAPPMPEPFEPTPWEPPAFQPAAPLPEPIGPATWEPAAFQPTMWEPTDIDQPVAAEPPVRRPDPINVDPPVRTDGFGPGARAGRNEAVIPAPPASILVDPPGRAAVGAAAAAGGAGAAAARSGRMPFFPFMPMGAMGGSGDEQSEPRRRTPRRHTRPL